MTLRTVVGLSLSVAVACASQPTAPAPPRPPLGSTHIAPHRIVSPEIQPPDPVTTPPELQRLSAIVAELAAEGGTMEHTEIIRAFRELAAAIAILAPDHTVEIEAIRRAADELETSHRRSLQHADYTRFGLAAAARTLAAISPRYSIYASRYAEAVLALDRAVEAVDPRTPLLEQHEATVEAFATATEVVAIAYGVVPPERVSAQ